MEVNTVIHINFALYLVKEKSFLTTVTETKNFPKNLSVTARISAFCRRRSAIFTRALKLLIETLVSLISYQIVHFEQLLVFLPVPHFEHKYDTLQNFSLQFLRNN